MPGRTVSYEGDPPFLFLDFKTVSKATAHATWTPAQDGGVEFHDPAEKQYASWNGMADVNLAAGTMSVDRPVDGHWFVLVGPTIVGAEMHWTMDLTVLAPASPFPPPVS